MLTEAGGDYRGVTEPAAEIIHQERSWFDASAGDVVELPRSRILPSRWTGNASSRCEHLSEIDADRHVLGVALRPMADLTVCADGKLIQSGHLPQGSMRVHEPGLPMRGIFQGQYDILHLHVPNAMIADYVSKGCGQRRTSRRFTDHRIVDPVVERLARAMIHAEKRLGGVFGRSFADGLSLAIIAQLFGRHPGCPGTTGARVSGLARWRLKRATDFVMANVAQPIGLADIAAAAGPSRMHFAAPFRVATGLQPHEYLQRRRVERIQELLLNSDLPLVEVAFEAGFENQSHFTTVFSRALGQTPNAWRQSNSSFSGKTPSVADLIPHNVALHASAGGVDLAVMWFAN
jgi:AraC family transcriptional regulator